MGFPVSPLFAVFPAIATVPAAAFAAATGFPVIAFVIPTGCSPRFGLYSTPGSNCIRTNICLVPRMTLIEKVKLTGSDPQSKRKHSIYYMAHLVCRQQGEVIRRICDDISFRRGVWRRRRISKPRKDERSIYPASRSLLD